MTIRWADHEQKPLLDIKEVDTLGQFMLDCKRQWEDPEADFRDTTLEETTTDNALRRRLSRHLGHMHERRPHWTSADTARYLDLQGIFDTLAATLETLEEDDISVSY